VLAGATSSADLGAYGMRASLVARRFSGSIVDVLSGTRAPLLFGLRLWLSVSLALFVAFWLQLDNPSWAGASAAIVCQPQLGASLRKGWFRMIGTVIGAIMIVVLTALFPQERIAYLGLLAFWGSVCAFAATVLRNYASYAAALAGYTAAIIAADTLGATGGASPDVFLLAVDRASAICIGIVSAGVVLALSDLGGAQRRLAVLFADLAAEIAGGFIRMLALAGPQLPDTQPERREFVRRVIALDPEIDQTLGESDNVRYHSPTLQAAVNGFFSALNGWRGVATHLRRLPSDMGRQQAEIILRSIPPELEAATEPGAAARWMADPVALRRACYAASQTLLAQPAETPSLRLLADETARMLSGMSYAFDGVALLVDAPYRRPSGHRGFRVSVPDWLPALVNAARAFVTIGAIELLWVVTAWPSGAEAIVFAAVMVLLLSPRGDLAYGAAVALGLGAAGAAVGAGIVKFALLPALGTFPAFSIAIGLYLVPLGIAIVSIQQPTVTAVLSAMSFLFLPLLAPTNQMSYDTIQFYNSVLAILVGCVIAPVAFRLLPPLSPALRARRLLALTLRDLRRTAASPVPASLEDWEGRMYGRLAALPDQAEPLQRSQLLAALSLGTEIINLGQIAPRLGVAAELDAALAALVQGNSALALTRLRELDRRLGAGPDAGSEPAATLRTRGRLTVAAEALAQYAPYFDGEVTA
jgi:uncharacterized membrane protein YccC